MGRHLCALSFLLVLVFPNLAIAIEGSATKSEAVSLFNGKNLDGWIQHGGKAKYTIEGDTIVGTSVANTPNSFLCTKREYSNFILEVELKVDDGLNSGIQIRSHVYDKPTKVTLTDSKGEKKIKKIPAGRVHGYQVEIDPDPKRSWSGGIYDESRRGWLNNLAGDKNKAARAAFQHGKWNKYRIVAIGNSIKTWVNGVPAANLTDDMDTTGFIALQVHSVREKKQIGKQVRWRNIRIQEVARKN